MEETTEHVYLGEGAAAAAATETETAAAQAPETAATPPAYAYYTPPHVRPQAETLAREELGSLLDNIVGRHFQVKTLFILQVESLFMTMISWRLFHSNTSVQN